MIANFRFRAYGLMAGLALSLGACSMVTPTTNVHQPMSVRPTMPARAENNGAIYSASSRSLFEDRRARYVGDTLTINLVEKTKASKSSNAGASRDSEMSVGTPTIAGLPLKNLVNKISAEEKAGQTFSGKGAAAANNDFTGTITVTVIEVFPNGNLLVSGEKQVSINQGDEFIRFSGIVNPLYVTTSNTVQSVQVADARVEYRARGYIDEAQTMGWLQRFFLNVLPF